MNRDFLKEAIADAKTVKESAIANAKLALEEAFEPQIKSMLAAKLEEMEKEDVDEEMKKDDDKVSEAKKEDDDKISSSSESSSLSLRIFSVSVSALLSNSHSKEFTI